MPNLPLTRPRPDGVTIFEEDGQLWKWLVVVRGEGTPAESRVTLPVKLYWTPTLGWVSLP